MYAHAGSQSNEIMTVTGPMQSSALGPTLPHEHLYCDLSVHSGQDDNRVTDTAAMNEELEIFRAAGGHAVIEVTCEGIGRNPLALQKLSESSGVRIISGIAFYDYHTWPAWAKQADAGKIADYFVSQIEEGTDGVCAGIIGELFSHNEPNSKPQDYKLDENELRLFAAAAQAQRRTGMAIITHASLGRGGHAQLDTLERARADLSRVAIGHCDAQWHPDADKDLEYYLPILERGASCAFDLIGWNELMSDDLRAKRVMKLVQMGYTKQVLLSSDTCRRSQLRTNGGRGLDHVLTSFCPLLREHGLTDPQIETMIVDSPRRLLCSR
ncbi:MAG: hypothetical protein JXM70_27780 [Pirellulales bacterium]|nr:hypothetical protein [Pirellulales bacterium]